MKYNKGCEYYSEEYVGNPGRVPCCAKNMAIETFDCSACRMAVMTVAVKAVPCKSCAYCEKSDDTELWCYGWGLPKRLVTSYDYCSHAKPEEEER